LIAQAHDIRHGNRNGCQAEQDYPLPQSKALFFTIQHRALPYFSLKYFIPDNHPSRTKTAMPSGMTIVRRKGHSTGDTRDSTAKRKATWRARSSSTATRNRLRDHWGRNVEWMAHTKEIVRTTAINALSEIQPLAIS